MLQRRDAYGCKSHVKGVCAVEVRKDLLGGEESSKRKQQQLQSLQQKGERHHQGTDKKSSG